MRRAAIGSADVEAVFGVRHLVFLENALGHFEADAAIGFELVVSGFQAGGRVRVDRPDLLAWRKRQGLVEAANGLDTAVELIVLLGPDEDVLEILREKSEQRVLIGQG